MCILVRSLQVLLGVSGFKVIRVHIVYVTIRVGVAKHFGRHGHVPYHCVPTKHFQKLATMVHGVYLYSMSKTILLYLCHPLKSGVFGDALFYVQTPNIVFMWFQSLNKYQESFPAH